MDDIKLELIKLLKIPVSGLTVIIVVWILGIEIGSVSEVGPEGIKFHPGKLNQTKEKEEVAVNENLNVSLPTTAKDTIEEVKSAKYSDKSASVGWVYLGTYVNGGWNDRLIEISEYLVPELAKSYVVLTDSVSVRTGKPSFPFYKLKTRIGFANKGDLIKIVDIDTDLGRNRVWAKVEVYPLLK